MAKAAIFTVKLEPDLRAEFIAAAEASQRPASQVVRELMRDFVDRRHERTAFIERKVAEARASVHDDRGRDDDAVEADFAARRARIIDET